RRRGGARGEQENTGGDEGGLPYESDVDPARGEQPVVGDLLDRGGYDEPADRRDDRDRGSDADALPHRRGEAHPFGDGAEHSEVGGGFDAGARRGGGHARASRCSRSRA